MTLAVWLLSRGVSVQVKKYAAMAQVMGHTLSSDPKRAASEILTYIKAPQTEWQIGKTKIFLRNTVFEPLEEKLKALLWERVVLIQTVWRGYRARIRYQRMKKSILLIQAAVVGATRRLMYRCTLLLCCCGMSSRLRNFVW